MVKKLNDFYLFTVWYIYLETSPFDATVGRSMYLLVVSCHFQHCTGHITVGSFVDRGHQYI